MGLFDSGEVIGIAADTLEFVLEAAADTHPREYMGLLRAEQATRLGLDREGRVLTEILVIPGTESNAVSASMKTNMIPNDATAAGSVHSHPSGVLRPSDTDLGTFSKGDVHIILGAPYGRTDWQAFDSEGRPRELPVLDVAAEDAVEEFFDFDQEDIDEELNR
ncbi:MAG: Mov34/MPN/PAD-1 family protein [Haloarculaceae archaeon]